MEEITTRTKSSTGIKFYMFTATSPDTVTEPPRLRPGQVAHLGDLLFNRFPDATATWEDAQVWMWTDPHNTGNPGWENISENYGSITESLTHPIETDRYLTKHKKDGKPGWVTKKTVQGYISEAKKEADVNLVN